MALLKYLEVALGQIRQPGPLHRALAKLVTSIVFTTNYDQLLERAIQEVHGSFPDVIISDDELFIGESRTSPSVIKLHGCLSVPETIAVTRDDYEQYAITRPQMSRFLHRTLGTRTFLFVGFSLADDNVRAILQQHPPGLLNGRRRAYVLDAHPEPRRHVTLFQAEGCQSPEFQPVIFRSFDEQRTFIEYLAWASRSPRFGPALPSRNSPSPDLALNR